MRPSSGRVSPITRSAAISFAALFLLFLSVSQPHRVHHFFEDYAHSHSKPEVDSENHDHSDDQTRPAQPDCAVQSLAQNCHLGQAELVVLPVIESHSESFEPQTNQWVDLFTSFSFFQRAPPKNTLSS